MESRIYKNGNHVIEYIDIFGQDDINHLYNAYKYNNNNNIKASYIKRHDVCERCHIDIACFMISKDTNSLYRKCEDIYS